MGDLRTFDTEQPWIVYTFGLTHDRWWPPHDSTRWLGRARIRCTCAVCGDSTTLTIKMPRWGDVPRVDQHPKRVAYKAEHAHPDRGAPMSWAMPLLNPSAHSGGVSLDALVMRLEADLNDTEGPADG